MVRGGGLVPPIESLVMSETQELGVVLMVAGFLVAYAVTKHGLKVLRSYSPARTDHWRLPLVARLELAANAAVLYLALDAIGLGSNLAHVAPTAWSLPAIAMVSAGLPMMIGSVVIFGRRMEMTPVTTPLGFTWREARDIGLFVAGFGLLALPAL